jgi:hypothetical protein
MSVPEIVALGASFPLASGETLGAVGGGVPCAGGGTFGVEVAPTCLLGPGLMGRTGSTFCDRVRRDADDGVEGGDADPSGAVAALAVDSGDSIALGCGETVALGDRVDRATGDDEAVGLGEGEIVALGEANGVALVDGDGDARGEGEGFGVAFFLVVDLLRCFPGVGVGFTGFAGFTKIFLIFSPSDSSSSAPRVGAMSVIVKVITIRMRDRSFGFTPSSFYD